jgi:hypothetical protein
MKCSTIQFHLGDAALVFYQKYKFESGKTQGVPIDQAKLVWDQLKRNLQNCFSGHETYESNEAKLRAIKWNPLSSESFFFSINLLDKLQIFDPARRVSKYIRQLPPDIARQMPRWLDSPLDDDDVFQQLKNLDNFHSSTMFGNTAECREYQNPLNNSRNSTNNKESEPYFSSRGSGSSLQHVEN